MAAVFEDRGKLYLIWSGWEDDKHGTQNIYVARMKNPWTVESARLRPWEKVGDYQTKHPDDPPHIDANEETEILPHDDKAFLIYSASNCWTEYFELGMGTATCGTDPLEASSGKKPSPAVFSICSRKRVLRDGSQFLLPIAPRQAELDAVPRELGSRFQGCGLHGSP